MDWLVGWVDVPPLQAMFYGAIGALAHTIVDLIWPRRGK